MLCYLKTVLRCLQRLIQYENLRHNWCSRKIRYETFESAQFFATSNANRPYTCPFCGGFHTTSKLGQWSPDEFTENEVSLSYIIKETDKHIKRLKKDEQRCK